MNGQPHIATAQRPQDAYNAAIRHSARVRTLKRLIPAGALLAFAIVVGISLINPFRSIGGLSMGPVSLSGSKITMDTPKLKGFRDGNLPYELSAAAATQDITKPDEVELQTINGRVSLGGDDFALIDAGTGVYDSKKEFMDLKGDVRVRTNAGYDARLSSATIDFKNGLVVSNEPVTVATNEGTISADRLDISENGKHIVFEGRVQAVMDGPARTKADDRK